jgi:hypothetical protein
MAGRFETGDDLEWALTRVGGGIVDRLDLIYMKLYAACDDVGPSSRHFRDLLALKPVAVELAGAARWVESQDTGLVEVAAKVVRSVRAQLE